MIPDFASLRSVASDDRFFGVPGEDVQRLAAGEFLKGDAEFFEPIRDGIERVCGERDRKQIDKLFSVLSYDGEIVVGNHLEAAGTVEPGDPGGSLQDFVDGFRAESIEGGTVTSKIVDDGFSAFDHRLQVLFFSQSTA